MYTDGEVSSGRPVLRGPGTVNARDRIQGIVMVTIQRALAITSPAYDVGATEDELRQRYLAMLMARPT